jgi:hypothetical protein
MKFEELIKSKFEDVEWDNIEIVFRIKAQTIGYDKIGYVNKNQEFIEKYVRLREIVPITNELRESFVAKKNSSQKFNKFYIRISANGSYEENFIWDYEDDLKDKLESANVFYQWLNETMMNRIFDFEKENDLLTPVHDDDGEFDYYESSYDNGMFCFQIKEKTIRHEIKLVKNEIERDLSMPLPEYITEGILEHHKITTEELSKEWASWNKLTIKSPHNSIPYDKWKEYVTYSMEKN